MDKDILKALKGSIKKWEKIVEGKGGYMLIEQRRKNGEPVAVIDCKAFLGDLDNSFCLWDADNNPIKRTEKCPSVGDEIRCYTLWDGGKI